MLQLLSTPHATTSVLPPPEQSCSCNRLLANRLLHFLHRCRLHVRVVLQCHPLLRKACCLCERGVGLPRRRFARTAFVHHLIDLLERETLGFLAHSIRCHVSNLRLPRLTGTRKYANVNEMMQSEPHRKNTLAPRLASLLSVPTRYGVMTLIIYVMVSEIRDTAGASDIRSSRTNWTMSRDRRHEHGLAGGKSPQ